MKRKRDSIEPKQDNYMLETSELDFEAKSAKKSK